jgi:6-phosphofructokinase 1
MRRICVTFVVHEMEGTSRDRRDLRHSYRLQRQREFSEEDVMKRIAVVTSGGDAPGINAAVRAIVRTAIDKGWETFGVRHGYSGLINDDFVPLNRRDVGGVIQRGGTMLGSKRYPEFRAEEAQVRATQVLRQREMDALVVIGGDGSQAGALALSQKGFPVIGVASTIDNDLYGSEISIGVDTALNVALEAIDRIKVTASSHERAFLVEVMGRQCGYLALISGIAGGAEYIVLPEIPTDPEMVACDLRAAYERRKAHAIVVVAEGACYNAEALTRYFQENRKRLGFELRVVKLGHVQRGGAPGVFDRLLATQMGAAATDCIARSEFGVLVGLVKGGIKTTPLIEIVSKKKLLDPHLLTLANVLAK